MLPCDIFYRLEEKERFLLMKKISTNSSSANGKIAFSVIHFAFCLLAIVGVVFLFFSPLCVIELSPDEKYTATALNSFKFLKSPLYELSSVAPLSLACLFILVFTLVLCVMRAVMAALSLKSEKRTARFSRRAVYTSCIVTLIYTAIEYLFAPFNIMIGGYGSVPKVDFFPLIFILAVTFIYSAFSGITGAFPSMASKTDTEDVSLLKNDAKKLRRVILYKHIELLFFALVSVAVALAAMLSDLVTVRFNVPGVSIPDYVISGSALLFNPESLTTSSEPMLAFVLFLMFFLVTVAILLSVASFLSRSPIFAKISLATVLLSAASTLAIGLFGQYYQIVQILNFDILTQIIVKYGIHSSELISYNVHSFSISFFALSLVITVILLLRSPFTESIALNRQLKEKTKQLEGGEDNDFAVSSESSTGASASEKKAISDFDPCPAFSALDKKAPALLAETEKNKASRFENPTLSDIADFIVQYARDCRLHLFYTKETVAAFLAGLGTTKLTILQGMSGTGKTSLPKIVSEALLAYCHIIEVESSWRDKNELIGYYNEFNKVFTPKKFTQAVYEAALNPDALTFIVLDEMNLSRIEYYFSDFLSLMENEPDKRELKLSNTPLFRTENGRSYRYLALNDGHTIKIPSNIWFIGTANRDESTYDISDKVYDRAHTMNFDRRAPKPQYFNSPIPPRSLSASALNALFEEAKSKISFKLEQAPIIAEVENLLLPYNISFGNRIANQMESFVSIYAACFESNEKVIHEALETILLSKVVKKLELKSIDDKELLAEEFEKLNLTKCSEFILSLKED